LHSFIACDLEQFYNLFSTFKIVAQHSDF